MRKIILTLVAACAASYLAVAGIRAVTPDAYGGNPRAWQIGRHNEKMVTVTNGGARVVFIGDSITHFWDSSDRGKEVWQKYFADGPYKALNLGISADRTEHLLWRLGEGGELDGYEAKCVLLMIGTNNSGHFPFSKEPPADTIAGIRRVLDLILAKQPKARIILTAIFPRDATAATAYRLRNGAVNKEICKFADGKRIIWCDFTDKFVDVQGRLSREIFPDLLHPNARGYEIWAASVLPLIEKCLTVPESAYIPSVWPAYPDNYSHGNALAAEPLAAYGQNTWWDKGVVLDHRNAIVAQGTNAAFDIVWVGDSITHRWCREKDEGCALWAKLSQNYTMLNLGIGGDRTENVLWRMRNGELEGYTAKMFTLMIGTNNDKRDVHGVARGIRLIIDEIKAKHPESKIVLMPIFPTQKAANDKRRLAGEAVNRLIKPYADGKTVLWLDFNARFLTPDGTLTKEMMSDLLHPTAKGYDIWWEALSPLAKDICGK